MMKTTLALALAMAATAAYAEEGTAGHSYWDMNNWKGWYAGVQGSTVDADTDWLYTANGARADHDIDGGVYGVHGGYAFQHGNWVFGPEVSVNLGEVDGEGRCPNPAFKCSSKVEDLSTVVARGGYAFGPVQPYAKVGVANAKFNTKADNGAGVVGDSNTRRNGLAYGAGVEVLITPCLSVGAEWTRINFEDKTQSVDSGLLVHTDTDPDMFTAKATYRF